MKDVNTSGKMERDREVVTREHWKACMGVGGLWRSGARTQG